MNFGEKIKSLRKEKGMSQAELAEAVGLSARAIQDYEIKNAHPKKREIYGKLASVLGVSRNYLLTEDEEFISQAQEKYGYQGVKDASELVSQISGLFAGGQVTEEMKDEVMQAIQDAYWAAKNENRKYGKKKTENE